MLARMAPQEWVYCEMRDVAALRFRHQEGEEEIDDTRVAEVARPFGNAPRLLRRWLPCSLLTRASSALPLAASFSQQ